MTLGEAAQAGICRLRQPVWHDRSYVKIDLVEVNDRNYHGPWVHLYDITQPVLGSPTPQDMLITQVPEDGWEAFEGELIPPDTETP